MIYTPGENPAVSLYNFWLTLLKAQGDLSPDLATSSKNYWGGDTNFPRVSYGDLQTGIGVRGFDENQNPVIDFGGYYRRQSGIYAYLSLTANGDFRLLNTHGDNHSRLERHTFLGYGNHGYSYVWYVSPSHQCGQNIDTRDWRHAVPYLDERVARQDYSQKMEDQKWMSVEKNSRGTWGIVAARRSINPDFDAAVARNQALVAKRYRLAQQNEVGYVPSMRVRSGSTSLTNDDALQHIAALIDVSRPAKSVPMLRTREVAVQ